MTAEYIDPKKKSISQQRVEGALYKEMPADLIGTPGHGKTSIPSDLVGDPDQGKTSIQAADMKVRELNVFGHTSNPVLGGIMAKLGAGEVKPTKPRGPQ